MQSNTIGNSFPQQFTSICEVNAISEENFETSFKDVKLKLKEYENCLASYINDLETISEDISIKEQCNRYKSITSKYQDKLLSSNKCNSSSSLDYNSNNNNSLPLVTPVTNPLSELKKDLNNKNLRLLDEYLLDNENENKKRNEEIKDLHLENIKLLSKLQDLKGNILVYTRVRPLLENEYKTQNENPNVIQTFNNTTISIVDSKEVKYSYNNSVTMDGPKLFEYDRCYNTDTTQEQIYEDFKPLVGSLLNGYNVSIIAYGQTGSGKTYTMFGTDENKGLNYRLLNELFNKINSNNSLIVDHEIQLSMVEIYNEKIIDLLKESNTATPCLSPNDSFNSNIGSTIKNLETDIKKQTILELNDLQRLIEIGSKLRSTASTEINTHSSRSHCIITIYIKQTEKKGNIINSRLYLVDLAGSERVSKSGVEGERLKEAQNINKSLSALGDVISALDNKQQHIPYRNSKLTMILKDSLSVNSKTVLLFNITPTLNSLSETFSTLNFASRVKRIEFGTIQKQIQFHDNEKEIKEIKKINTQLKNENEKMIEEIKNLKNQMKECNTLKDDMNNKLSNELKEKDDVLMAYKKKLKLLNAHCIKYKTNCEDMVKEKSKLEHEIENQSKLIKSLEEYKNENDVLHKQNTELKKKLSSLNSSGSNDCKLEMKKKMVVMNNSKKNNVIVKPKNNQTKIRTIDKDNPHVFTFDDASTSNSNNINNNNNVKVIKNPSSSHIPCDSKYPTDSLKKTTSTATFTAASTTTTTLQPTKSDYFDLNNYSKYKFGQSLLFRKMKPNNKAPTPLFSDDNDIKTNNKRNPPKLPIKGKKSNILDEMKSDEKPKSHFSDSKLSKTVSHSDLINNRTVKFEYLKKGGKTSPLFINPQK